MRGSLHSSVILTRAGLWGQVVGLPSPPGMIAFIPKYTWCSLESPWRIHGWSLCRVIPCYGPRGLEEAMESLGVEWRRDPLYGAVMPYALLEDLLLLLHPRRILEEIASHPPPSSLAVVEAAGLVSRMAGVSASDLGVTGSHAMGAPHEGSDVDLVVYGGGAAAKVYEYFKASGSTPSTDGLGGVVVHPQVDASWRRGSIGGRSVTWTGVPVEWHCPPLRDYYSITPPEHRVKVRVLVEGGQEGALLYPPCVEAGGYYIVSYEYNLGGVLYEGGRLEIHAAASGGNVLFIGVREYPGLVKRLDLTGGRGSQYLQGL